MDSMRRDFGGDQSEDWTLNTCFQVQDFRGYESSEWQAFRVHHI